LQGTIVNPPKGGEYDLDDGVYLQDLDAEDISKWPPTKTVHKWVLDAVRGHADDEQDKETCVRVIYKADYHIDFPIYSYLGNDCYLAKKEAGWELNDSARLNDWIRDAIQKHGNQYLAIIRYFKAWKDEQNKKSKICNGLYLTILSEEVFVGGQRNDMSFAKTVAAMKNRIDENDDVKNPVDDSESLTKRLTSAQRKSFKDALAQLNEAADKALAESSKKCSCETWKDELGEHFPSCEKCCESSEDEDKLVTSAPALVKNDKKSAC